MGVREAIQDLEFRKGCAQCVKNTQPGKIIYVTAEGRCISCDYDLRNVTATKVCYEIYDDGREWERQMTERLQAMEKRIAALEAEEAQECKKYT